MKTTFDLPDDLVREMKLRAAMQGRTLGDLATDFIRQGLGLAEPRPVQELPTTSPVQVGANGVPVVRCRTDAPAQLMALDDLLALEQQAQNQEDMQRAGTLFDTNIWRACIFPTQLSHAVAQQTLLQATTAQLAVW